MPGWQLGLAWGGVAVTPGPPLGLLYVADTGNNRIRVVYGDGSVATVAGTGVAGYVNGPGSTAQFNNPTGVAVVHNMSGGFSMWPDGTLFVCDKGNGVIRRITPEGVVSQYLSPGWIANPHHCALDEYGWMYVTDPVARRVYVVTPYYYSTPPGAFGTVYTSAGSDPTGPDPATFRDGGTTARMSRPLGIMADADRRVYFVDQLAHRLRLVSDIQSSVQPAGFMTTVAGNGFAGNLDGSTLGHAGLMAELSSPTDVTVDALGRLYVTDATNRIRKVSDGVVKSVGSAGGTAIGNDVAGAVYVARADSTIGRLDSAGVETWFSGSGPGFADGPAGVAKFNNPQGISMSKRPITVPLPTTLTVGIISSPSWYAGGLTAHPNGSLYFRDRDWPKRVNLPSGVITNMTRSPDGALFNNYGGIPGDFVVDDHGDLVVATYDGLQGYGEPNAIFLMDLVSPNVARDLGPLVLRLMDGNYPLTQGVDDVGFTTLAPQALATIDGRTIYWSDKDNRVRKMTRSSTVSLPTPILRQNFRGLSSMPAGWNVVPGYAVGFDPHGLTGNGPTPGSSSIMTTIIDTGYVVDFPTAFTILIQDDGDGNVVDYQVSISDGGGERMWLDVGGYEVGNQGFAAGRGRPGNGVGAVGQWWRQAAITFGTVNGGDEIIGYVINSMSFLGVMAGAVRISAAFGGDPALIRPRPNSKVTITMAGQNFAGTHPRLAEFRIYPGVLTTAQVSKALGEMAAGNLYQIATIPTAIIETVAGTGVAGHVDGPVASAQFDHPIDIAARSNGDLFVFDGERYVTRASIRKISGGVVSTVVEFDVYDYAGGLVVDDATGNLFAVVVDRILRIAPSGQINLVADRIPDYFGSSPLALALDGSALYWVNYSVWPSPSAIVRKVTL